MFALAHKAALLLATLLCIKVLVNKAEIASQLEYDSEFDDGEMIDDILVGHRQDNDVTETMSCRAGMAEILKTLH